MLTLNCLYGNKIRFKPLPRFSLTQKAQNESANRKRFGKKRRSACGRGSGEAVAFSKTDLQASRKNFVLRLNTANLLRKPKIHTLRKTFGALVQCEHTDKLLFSGKGITPSADGYTSSVSHSLNTFSSRGRLSKKLP